MKTEFKVLLYLKRNGQGKDGLCPLMGKIMLKGITNSVAQFGCKIKVDPKLWNASLLAVEFASMLPDQPKLLPV